MIDLDLLCKRFKLISILDKIIKEGWENIPPFFNFTNISYYYPNYEVNLLIGHCTISSKNINLIRNYKLSNVDFENFINKYKSFLINEDLINIKAVDYKEEYFKLLVYYYDYILYNSLSSLLSNLKYTIYNLSYSVIINIPELNIKNSNNVNHTMRGLYLRLTFDRFSLCNIYLARNTYTYGEYIAGYRFSHIRSFDTTNVYKYNSNFCYGRNALIPSSLQSYNSESNLVDTRFSGVIKNRILKTLTEEESKNLSFYLQNYLISFINYLSWESLEGGPYVKMANTSSKKYWFSYTPKINFEIFDDLEDDYIRKINPAVKVLFKEMFNYFIKNDILTFSIIDGNKITISNNRKDLINYCYAYLKANENYLNHNQLSSSIVYYKTDDKDIMMYCFKDTDSFEQSISNYLNSESTIYFNNSYVKGILFNENEERDFLETINPDLFNEFINFTNILLFEYTFIKNQKLNSYKKPLIISIHE